MRTFPMTARKFNRKGLPIKSGQSRCPFLVNHRSARNPGQLPLANNSLPSRTLRAHVSAAPLKRRGETPAGMPVSRGFPRLAWLGISRPLLARNFRPSFSGRHLRWLWADAQPVCQTHCVVRGVDFHVVVEIHKNVTPPGPRCGGLIQQLRSRGISPATPCADFFSHPANAFVL